MRATLTICVIVLVAIGVLAGIARALFIGDLGARLEPSRTRFLHAIGRDDPYQAFRAPDVKEVDGKFGAYRTVTLLHVIPGALFLLLAPLQFVSRVRTRFIAVHRRLGRVLMIAALISGGSGMFFGLLMPYGGRSEAIGIGIFGGLLFFSVTRAFVAIRRGQVTVHREWMIRAFAIALAISTVRVIAGALDIAHIPPNAPRIMFLLSIWSGWVVTVGIAELWIRATRAVALTASHDELLAVRS